MSETVQSIIGFPESRASGTTLSESQMNTLISELRGKVGQLSVDVPGAQPGALTLLYSNWVADGIHSGTVVVKTGSDSI